MINTFTVETGVNVEDLYWVGNIGHHAKKLTIQMLDYFKQAFNTLEASFPQNKLATSTRQAIDPCDSEMMIRHWGQEAWFNTFYEGMSHDGMSAKIGELAILPGLNEILKAESMNLNDVKVSLNAGDWMATTDKDDEKSVTTAGSLLVCLQAPHGCMLKAGDNELKVRRGDVIMLNDRVKHSMIPAKPIYMPKTDNESKAEWINHHGLLFMQFNKMKKAA